MSQKDDIVQCLPSGIEKPVLIIGDANLPADHKVVERWRHHGGHEKNLTRGIKRILATVRLRSSFHEMANGERVHPQL